MRWKLHKLKTCNCETTKNPRDTYIFSKANMETFATDLPYLNGRFNNSTRQKRKFPFDPSPVPIDIGMFHFPDNTRTNEETENLHDDFENDHDRQSQILTNQSTRLNRDIHKIIKLSTLSEKRVRLTKLKSNCQSETGILNLLPQIETVANVTWPWPAEKETRNVVCADWLRISASIRWLYSVFCQPGHAITLRVLNNTFFISRINKKCRICSDCQNNEILIERECDSRTVFTLQL